MYLILGDIEQNFGPVPVIIIQKKIELQHDKTNAMTCVPKIVQRKDSYDNSVLIFVHYFRQTTNAKQLT